MRILVTGASGFLGSALIPLLIEKGHRVYGLSRHPPAPSESLIPITGDITLPNLGLKDVPESIMAVYHLAGDHSLTKKDKDGEIWKTNVGGTRKVLLFCQKYNIPRLYFTSTAYTWPVNPYGLSKIQNEKDIARFTRKHGLKATIFKPSIVLGTARHPYPGHFSRFISAVIHAHHRAELIRRGFESQVRLLPLRPLFRVKGTPEGKLNLIQIDQVARGIADIEDTGTFWLTHPDPPTLQQLADWIGEVIMVLMKFETEFKPTPIEAAFHKIMAAFTPYLHGDNFPSNLQLSPPITKSFIQETAKRTVLD